MRHNKKVTLSSLLAKNFLDTIKNSAFTPSVRTLSRLYAISYPTALKIAQTLRKDGWIHFKKGSKITLNPSEHLTVNLENNLKRINTTNQLLSQIQGEISSGALKSGEYLPKITYLMGKYHLSYSIVKKSLSILENNNFILKIGNRYQVGRQIKLRIGSSNFIYIVLPRENTWEGIYKSPRTTHFAHEFMGALTNLKLNIKWLVIENSTYPILQKQNCLGALVVGKPNQYSDFSSSIVHLSKNLRRVVWFNSAGETW